MTNKSEFYANGYDDYLDGNLTNPYPTGSAAAEHWDAGNDQAAADNGEER